MSSGCVGCPSHPVARLLGLSFSRFLNFHYLDSFGAEPQIFLCSPDILPRTLSGLCPIAVFSNVHENFHENSSSYEAPISLV